MSRWWEEDFEGQRRGAALLISDTETGIYVRVTNGPRSRGHKHRWYVDSSCTYCLCGKRHPTEGRRT